MSTGIDVAALQGTPKHRRGSSTQVQDPLEARLAALERKLDRVAGLLEALPAMSAVAADTFDDALEQTRQRGVDVEARLAQGGELLERLTRLVDLAEGLPGLGMIAADTFDETVMRLRLADVDIESRSGDVSGLIEALTRPETVALRTLIDALPRLEPLLSLVEDAPHLASIAVDTADEYMTKLRRDGLDVEKVLENGAKTAQALTQAAAQAYTETQADNRLGVIATYRALRDPDVQRTLTFALALAKAVGPHLKAGGTK